MLSFHISLVIVNLCYLGTLQSNLKRVMPLYGLRLSEFCHESDYPSEITPCLLINELQNLIQTSKGYHT